MKRSVEDMAEVLRENAHAGKVWEPHTPFERASVVATADREPQGVTSAGDGTAAVCGTRPLITLVMPYYNEAGFIERSLESLAQQKDRRFTLVLVDNASTDDSQARVLRSCAGLSDIAIRFMIENNPGKIHALVTGLAQIDTPYVATLDADTSYPPEYVGNCIALFESNPDAAAVMAIGLSCALGPTAQRRVLSATKLRSQLWSAKCHSGAYAQSFRTSAFRAAGGYDPAIWNFVLEDHEIVYRIARFGRLVYDTRHFCITSNRRTDRTGVSWTLAERLLYAVVPRSKLAWYFHGFLAARFARRNLSNLNLRTFARRNDATHRIRAGDAVQTGGTPPARHYQPTHPRRTVTK